MTYVSATTSATVLQVNCHAIGHVIGEKSYRNFGTIEAALAQCNSSCRNACTHGVIGAGVMNEMGKQYSEEDIAHAGRKQLDIYAKQYCANSDSSNSTCHAIGHLAYIATSDDESALGICDRAATGLHLQSCFQGVFMERAASFANVLFVGTSKPAPEVRKDDYTYPCMDLAERYRNACFVLLPSFQAYITEAEGLKTPAQRLQKSVEACESLPRKNRSDCFEGIGVSSATLGASDLYAPETELFCDQFSGEEDRYSCIVGLLTRFAYADFRGIQYYCEHLDQEGMRALCYNASFQWIEGRFHFDYDPARMCTEYRTCLDRYVEFNEIRDELPDYRFGLFGDPGPIKKRSTQ